MSGVWSVRLDRSPPRFVWGNLVGIYTIVALRWGLAAAGLSHFAVLFAATLTARLLLACALRS